MKTVDSVMKKAFPLREVGEKECEVCGHVYKLYKTSKGILGACKPCADREMIKKYAIPTVEQYQKTKETRFILQFERVTNDLKPVTVKSYKPMNESQIKAKQAAVKFVKEFRQNKGQSLVFSGAPGLGKSHLAYAIAKAVRDMGFKVLFVKTTHLLDHIRATYKPNSNITEEILFDMLNNLDLLVLDDIGSEYVKKTEEHESWASDVLYKIFDSRIDKPIICTTNYSESELAKKYGNNGPRIISRMLNQAVGFRLKGEDMRRSKEAF